ncbi:MAG: cobalamin biosynthesis protein CbiM [Nitrospirae bacterium]|nr:MAG: cobalamin biosynthesis protein CbiM [Nitrospirota bacterium]
MHIPDGYLAPATYLPAWGVAVPLLWHGARRLRRSLEGETLPTLSALTGLAFVVQMLNIPLPGGTTGHALGTALIALLYGPWSASCALAVVLLVQALLFGDGGITTYPVNLLAMGFAAAFTAHRIHRAARGRLGEGRAAFLAGWAGAVAASAVVALALGIQPWLAHDAAGRPLFFPLGLRVTVPAIVGSHALLFGVAEGAYTAAVLALLRRTAPAAAEARP